MTWSSCQINFVCVHRQKWTESFVIRDRSSGKFADTIPDHIVSFSQITKTGVVFDTGSARNQEREYAVRDDHTLGTIKSRPPHDPYLPQTSFPLRLRQRNMGPYQFCISAASAPKLGQKQSRTQLLICRCL